MRIVLILFGFLVFSCQSDQISMNTSLGNRGANKQMYIPQNADEAESLNVEDDINMEPPRNQEPSAQQEPYLAKGSKIIKNGNMEFDVSHLEEAKDKVDSILIKHKGYYENEKYNAHGYQTSYSLILRMPSAHFDPLIDFLESGIGDLKIKNITADDVTEEYLDLNIRLDNQLAYLAKYKDILDKTATVKEILEVQDKIRRIEVEIESKKGRIRFLDDQASFSTLHLEINELIAPDIASNPNFGRRLINAFNNGVIMFSGLIIGLVSFWPFILLLGLLLLASRTFLRGEKIVKTESQ